MPENKENPTPEEVTETDVEGHSIEVEAGDADETNFNIGCCV